jgi:hypothetical protein
MSKLHKYTAIYVTYLFWWRMFTCFGGVHLLVHLPVLVAYVYLFWWRTFIGALTCFGGVSDQAY